MKSDPNLLSEDITTKFLNAVATVHNDLNRMFVAESSLNSDDILGYIQGFDHTPIGDMQLTVKDHVRVYSWLQELRTYRNFAGKISDITQFRQTFGYNPLSELDGEEVEDYEDDD